MNNKKIIIGAIVGISLIIVYTIFFRGGNSNRDYVFNDIQDVSGEEARLILKDVDFQDKEKVQSLFSEDVVNAYTIRFFRSISMKFRESKTFENQMDDVEQYLLTIMDESKAKDVMKLYRKYVTYQKGYAVRIKDWGMPKTMDEAIQFLKNRYEYQKEMFGPDVAKVLFGLEVKKAEYSVRRNVIINEEGLYGADKEKRMLELNEGMWGDSDGISDVNKSPYSRYQEKRVIYGKDLSEMSGEEKTAKIKEFRQQIFPAEIVERLNEVDELLASKREAETEYRQEEQKILNDPNLDANEKTTKITELQNSLFGEDAAAFRRRENIRKAREKRGK